MNIAKFIYVFLTNLMYSPLSLPFPPFLPLHLPRFTPSPYIPSLLTTSIHNSGTSASFNPSPYIQSLLTTYIHNSGTSASFYPFSLYPISAYYLYT